MTSLTAPVLHRTPSTSPDVEEGEINDSTEDSTAAVLGLRWGGEKQAHAWLLLALHERLGGNGLQAREASDKALLAACGNMQVWETLGIADWHTPNQFPF